MANKKKKEKKSFLDTVWEDFAKTGAIGTYLLYRNLKDGRD